MQTLKQKLTSRKFLLAVATALVNLYFIVTGKDVDPSFVISFTAIVAAWITGETVLDHKAIEFNGLFAQRLAMAQMSALLAQVESESVTTDIDPQSAFPGPIPV